MTHPKPYGAKRRWRACRAKCRLGIQCERDGGHKGKHSYDLAYGGAYRWAPSRERVTRWRK